MTDSNDDSSKIPIQFDPSVSGPKAAPQLAEKALIEKYVALARRSLENNYPRVTQTPSQRPHQRGPNDALSPTISELSSGDHGFHFSPLNSTRLPQAVPRNGQDDHASLAKTVPAESTRNSGLSRVDTRDERFATYPFPIVEAPSDPPSPSRGYPPRLQKASASPLSSRASSTRRPSDGPGLPPISGVPVLKAPHPGSAAFAAASKQYYADSQSFKSHASKHSGDTMADSAILVELDGNEEQNVPTVPYGLAPHDPTRLRDSIRTLAPTETVNLGYASYGHTITPVVRDVRSNENMSGATKLGHVGSQNPSGQRLSPSQSRKSSLSPRPNQQDIQLTELPSESLRSVSPIATIALPRDPSDETIVSSASRTARSGGTSPLVRAHSRFSSRFDAPLADHNSDVSNPFTDTHSAKSRTQVPAPEESPQKNMNRNSRSSLNEMIKRSMRLGSHLGNGVPAAKGGRVSTVALPEDTGNRFEDRRSWRRSNFPPQQSNTAYSQHIRGLSSSTRPSNMQSITSQYHNALEKEETSSRNSNRKRCCRLPIWLFVLIIVGIVVVIAVAVIVPVVVVVIPNQDHDPPNPTGTNLAQQVSACQNVLSCENGGVSVLTSAGNCGCVCINSYTGTTCNKLGSSGCTTFDTGSISGATVGVALPHLFQVASPQYIVPLNSTMLVSLFSFANLNCDAENELVAFNGVKSHLFDNNRHPTKSHSPLALPAVTPAPSINTLQTLQRRQAAETVSGLILAASTDLMSSTTASPTSTSLSATLLNGPVATPTGSVFSPLAEQTVEFAGISILYIFQVTATFEDALQAQTKLQGFFSQFNSSSQTIPSASGTVDLENGFSADLSLRTLSFKGQPIAG